MRRSKIDPRTTLSQDTFVNVRASCIRCAIASSHSRLSNVDNGAKLYGLDFHCDAMHGVRSVQLSVHGCVGTWSGWCFEEKVASRSFN